MAYDLAWLAAEIDRRLQDGEFRLKIICDELSIHRHTATNALYVVFGCCFETRKTYWRVDRGRRLIEQGKVTGKELASELGYANARDARRYAKAAGILRAHKSTRDLSATDVTIPSDEVLRDQCLPSAVGADGRKRLFLATLRR